MRVVVTSSVVFEVPDGDAIETVRTNFEAANRAYIGRAMVTVTGQPYVLVAIERLVVERRVM